MAAAMGGLGGMIFGIGFGLAITDTAPLAGAILALAGGFMIMFGLHMATQDEQ